MSEETIGDIVLKKVRSDGIVMSRIPKNTRDNFILIADNEFASDYGMALKFLLDQCIEYQQIKFILFNDVNIKLDYIIEKINKVSPSEEKEKKIEPVKRKMLDGSNRTVRKGGEIEHE